MMQHYMVYVHTISKVFHAWTQCFYSTMWYMYSTHYFYSTLWYVHNNSAVLYGTCTQYFYSNGLYMLSESGG